MNTGSPDNGAGTQGRLVAARELPRLKATLASLAAAVTVGVGFSFLEIDFTPRPALILALAAAIAAVTAAHEGVHGAAGALLGHRPVFGFKPPFVYTTFRAAMPKNHLVVIALAPLVAVDLGAAALYFTGSAPLFGALCFGINTLGSAGDVWVASVLLAAQRGTMARDTVSGVEIWSE